MAQANYDSIMTQHPTLGWVREVRQYNCPFCKTDSLPELANFCPNCGAKFKWEKFKPTNFLKEHKNEIKQNENQRP